MKPENKYLLLLILIFLLAIFLRFYRLNERYSVFADMARDVLVAREAVKLGFNHWPLVGSFSSAGPFVFGPLFYWLISLTYLINVNLLILPWLFTAFVSLVFIAVMFKAGESLGGKKLAIVCALLSAVSPAQVWRAEALTQHSYIGIASAVTLWAFILCFKKKQARWFFLMGLAIGFGLSLHYQAINLLFFPLAAFVFKLLKLPKLLKLLKNLLALGLGLLLPSLPLLLWDSQQAFANLRNLLDYLFIGQYRIYVPNRWLTYVTQFWPEFWGSIIGGLPFFGWLLAALFTFFLINAFRKGKISRVLVWLAIIFLAQFILLRYHRGERFEGYLIYFHPLIIFFSAWALNKLAQKILALAIITLLLIVFFSLKTDFNHILESSNQVSALNAVVDDLKKQYPDKKFSLYDHQFATASHSFGVSLFLDREGLIDKNSGVNLGACDLTCPAGLPVVSRAYATLKIVDLSALDKNQLAKPEWTSVNPRDVFEDVTLWWQKEPLKSPFSLKKYLMDWLSRLFHRNGG